MSIVIGITGSIGAGKSTVAKMFEEYGYSVQNADYVVHNIYKNDIDTIEKIANEFSGSVINGEIDRNKLKQYIKDNPDNKLKLEKIVHPVVARTRDEFLANNEKAVLDVPLLFEANVDEHCDVVIVVACDYEIRKQRVINRGVSEEVFDMLNNSQISQDEKITRGDIVINTNKSIDETSSDVCEVIKQIEKDFFNA